MFYDIPGPPSTQKYPLYVHWNGKCYHLSPPHAVVCDGQKLFWPPFSTEVMMITITTLTKPHPSNPLFQSPLLPRIIVMSCANNKNNYGPWAIGEKNLSSNFYNLITLFPRKCFVTTTFVIISLCSHKSFHTSALLPKIDQWFMSSRWEMNVVPFYTIFYCIFQQGSSLHPHPKQDSCSQNSFLDPCEPLCLCTMVLDCTLLILNLTWKDNISFRLKISFPSVPSTLK